MVDKYMRVLVYMILKKYCEKQIDHLWEEVKRFEKPHEYFVDLSQPLWDIKDKLLKENQ